MILLIKFGLDKQIARQAEILKWVLLKNYFPDASMTYSYAYLTFPGASMTFPGAYMTFPYNNIS